jgi:hypothetical protein
MSGEDVCFLPVATPGAPRVSRPVSRQALELHIDFINPPPAPLRMYRRHRSQNHLYIMQFDAKRYNETRTPPRLACRRHSRGGGGPSRQEHRCSPFAASAVSDTRTPIRGANSTAIWRPVSIYHSRLATDHHHRESDGPRRELDVRARRSGRVCHAKADEVRPMVMIER